MSDKQPAVSPAALLRLSNWLSPAFPTGAFAYSHGLEWAVADGAVLDRASLLDWLSADLRFGSGRNEAIFFVHAARLAAQDDRERLFRLAELAAAFRGTAEFSIESSQQAEAYCAVFGQVWANPLMDWLRATLSSVGIHPSVAVVLGVQTAHHGIPECLALPTFLQAYAANLVTAAIRLVPIGQFDGQRAIAELEDVILLVNEEAQGATLDDLGSAALMVDFASSFHENQQPRLFRT